MAAGISMRELSIAFTLSVPLLDGPCNLLVEAVVGRIHTVVEVVHNCRHNGVGRRRTVGNSWCCVYRIPSVTRTVSASNGNEKRTETRNLYKRKKDLRQYQLVVDELYESEVVG